MNGMDEMYIIRLIHTYATLDHKSIKMNIIFYNIL